MKFTDGWFWLSSSKMTFVVEVIDNKIVKTAPIVRKFIGQPMVNLIRWMRKQKGFKMYSYQSERWAK